MKVIVHGKQVLFRTVQGAETKDVSLTADCVETDNGICSEALVDLIRSSRFNSITGIEVEE